MTDIVTRDQCTINPPVTFYIGGGYFFTQYVPVNHYVCSVCGALDIVHTVSTLPISPNAVMGSDHRHRRRFVYVLPGEKPLHSFMEPFRRGWQRLVRQKRSLFVFNHHEPSKELK